MPGFHLTKLYAKFKLETELEELKFSSVLVFQVPAKNHRLKSVVT
jgi:hypothetical protein